MTDFQLQGAVDGFTAPHRLSGWARATAGPAGPLHSDGTPPITVTAYFRGLAIGGTEVAVFRKDLAGPHGFAIDLMMPLKPSDIVEGAVKVRAVLADGPAVEIPFFEGLLKGLGVDAASDDGALLTLLRTQARSDPTSPLRRRLQQSIAFIASSPTDQFLLPTGTGELSSVGLKVGMKSPNAIAVVGRNGFLFVYRGTNDLFAQYGRTIEDSDIAATAAAWLDAFDARRRALEGRGRRYLQLIVPEKSTVLSEHYPLSIPDRTPVLARIERDMAARPALAACYLDCRGLLVAHDRRQETFLKLDTHMTVTGTRILFEAILARMGFPIGIAVDLPVTIHREADLGNAFTGMAMHEVLHLPQTAAFAAQEAQLTRVEAHMPASGQHIGTRCVWRNEGAPIPLKVVAFANSFFERGTTAMTLSWWFARWFREFHFLWDPQVDFDYVDANKPDWIICQTIERFLPVAPEA